jgi:hypothetical protein
MTIRSTARGVALAALAGLLLAAAVLAPAPAARAALQAVEQALELPLATVRLPPAESGALVVRRCARCAPEFMRVTPGTRYFVRPGTQPVALREARKAAAGAAGRATALVYVYYEPGPRTVSRLVLDPGP